MSKYGDRKEKIQLKPFLFSSFSKLSSPCFLAKEEIFLLQTLREKKKKKSQQHSPWDAAVLLSCCGRVNGEATAPWWSPDRRVTHSHNAASQSNTWWCAATFHSRKLFSRVRHILLLAQREQTFFQFCNYRMSHNNHGAKNGPHLIKRPLAVDNGCHSYHWCCCLKCYEALYNSIKKMPVHFSLKKKIMVRLTQHVSAKRQKTPSFG